MDDLLLNDCGRPVLVAVVDLCLGGIFHRRLLYLSDRKDWSHLPHLLPGRHKSVFRHLGLIVAGLQSSRYGLHMDGSPVMDWR